ncbi:peptidoglycan-binding protein [Streptomyces sp. NPDC017529]|uniref:peptidoglycan-binding protein n=1 Tax=Streptomyces sp. NPDC017529 TaxID=3365000 RepID=UPI00378B5A28
MTAETCPHCSAPSRADGRTRCLCEAAGAEDFDPLRVRPYVRLPDEADAGGAGPDAAARALRPDPRPAPRFGFRTVPPAGSRAGARGGSRAGPRPGSRTGSHSGSCAGTQSDRASGAHSGGSESGEVHGDASRRRRRQVALGVMAASAAALAAGAVLLSGALLSDADEDRALLDDHRSVPTAARTADDGTDSGSGGGPGRRAAPPPASPTRTPHRPPGAQPAPGPSRTPSPPPSPSHAPGTATASGDITSAPESRAPSSPPGGPIVLREGATGPEVLELQRRLEQLAAYFGPEDARYGAAVRAAVAAFQRSYGVRGDPDGVYGPRTRGSLEARTVEP